jgi:hypothetical protein
MRQRMGQPRALPRPRLSARQAIVDHMSRDDKTPDEHVAQTRDWKARLRSTPEGEAEYQEMCAKAIDAAERLATRRSA